VYRFPSLSLSLSLLRARNVSFSLTVPWETADCSIKRSADKYAASLTRRPTDARWRIVGEEKGEEERERRVFARRGQYVARACIYAKIKRRLDRWESNGSTRQEFKEITRSEQRKKKKERSPCSEINSIGDRQLPPTQNRPSYHRQLISLVDGCSFPRRVTCQPTGAPHPFSWSLEPRMRSRGCRGETSRAGIVWQRKRGCVKPVFRQRDAWSSSTEFDGLLCEGGGGEMRGRRDEAPWDATEAAPPCGAARRRAKWKKLSRHAPLPPFVAEDYRCAIGSCSIRLMRPCYEGIDATISDATCKRDFPSRLRMRSHLASLSRESHGRARIVGSHVIAMIIRGVTATWRWVEGRDGRWWEGSRMTRRHSRAYFRGRRRGGAQQLHADPRRINYGPLVSSARARISAATRRNSICRIPSRATRLPADINFGGRPLCRPAVV